MSTWLRCILKKQWVRDKFNTFVLTASFLSFQCQLAQIPDDIKLESLCLLAKIYANQNQFPSAITLLQQAYDLSGQQPYWHCRIIFQIIVSNLRKRRCRTTAIEIFSISTTHKTTSTPHSTISSAGSSFVRESMHSFVRFSFNWPRQWYEEHSCARMKTLGSNILVANAGQRLFGSTESIETMLGTDQRTARELFSYRNIENSLFGLTYLVFMFWTWPSMCIRFPLSDIPSVSLLSNRSNHLKRPSCSFSRVFKT